MTTAMVWAPDGAAVRSFVLMNGHLIAREAVTNSVAEGIAIDGYCGRIGAIKPLAMTVAPNVLKWSVSR